MDFCKVKGFCYYVILVHTLLVQLVIITCQTNSAIASGFYQFSAVISLSVLSPVHVCPSELFNNIKVSCKRAAIQCGVTLHLTKYVLY